MNESKSTDFTGLIKKRASIFLFVILLANFFRNLGVSIVDIGLPTFVLNLSGTLTSYGLIIGMFSITQSVFQFPMALASDKYGRKVMVLIGISVYISGTFLCFIAQDIVQLIIFRAIQGAGAYSSILQAMIGDHYREEHHGKGMAFYSFSLSLGYFGGIIMGGYVSYFLGFRSIFFISGVLATFSGILFLTFLKDPKKLNSTKIQNKNKISEEISKNPNIKLLLKENQYILAVVLNCIRWFLFGGIVVYLIWVLQVSWSLNQIETSYLLIFVVLAYIIFVITSGRLVDRFGSKNVMLFGQFLIISFGTFFFIVSITHDLWLFFFASLFSGIGFALFQTSANSNLLDIIQKTHPELKGTGFGFNNAIGFFCGALGPIILSILGEFSLFLPYYFIAILVILAFILAFKYIQK